MTTTRDERYSALIDGEVSDFEQRRLVDDLLKDEEAQASWVRMHLIGDALREELPQSLDMDFVAKLRDKIDEEPEYNERPAQGGKAGWIKPASGFAVAASVALVSILSLQSMVGYDTNPTSTVPVASQSSPAIVPAGDNFRLASSPASGTVKQGVTNQEVEQRINRYLVNHSEFASRPGVLPHARIVGYEKTKD
jgi:sigma-E factor negative regulatory protein RseA